jgi:PHD/YefM family antitoxin component YafN of YafNO toxin-antitoxin module
MTRLTPDQRQAIQQAGERPVEITDPDTNAAYYLVPADQFREMMELLEEERQRRAIARKALRNAAARMEEA